MTYYTTRQEQNYLEDSSQMQNAWYQQDICFKCPKYTQSFEWFDSEV